MVLTQRPTSTLMEKFGNRLLFGMSIPTLNNALAKVYEPKARAPTWRLQLRPQSHRSRHPFLCGDGTNIPRM